MVVFSGSSRLNFKGIEQPLLLGLVDALQRQPRTQVSISKALSSLCYGAWGAAVLLARTVSISKALSSLCYSVDALRAAGDTYVSISKALSSLCYRFRIPRIIPRR